MSIPTAKCAELNQPAQAENLPSNVPEKTCQRHPKLVSLDRSNGDCRHMVKQYGGRRVTHHRTDSQESVTLLSINWYTSEWSLEVWCINLLALHYQKTKHEPYFSKTCKLQTMIETGSIEIFCTSKWTFPAAPSAQTSTL